MKNTLPILKASLTVLMFTSLATTSLSLDALDRLMPAAGVPFYPDHFTRTLIRKQNEACIKKITEAIFFCNLAICVRCQEHDSARRSASASSNGSLPAFRWLNQSSSIFARCPLDCFDNDVFDWCSRMLLDKSSPSIL